MVRSAAFVVVLVVLAASAVPAQTRTAPLTVASPDGALVVTVTAGAHVEWAVAWRGRDLLLPSRMALVLAEGRTLGAAATIAGTSTRAVNTPLRPVVPYRRAEVPDRFNERRIDFAGGYGLIVRAYDDGVAYRWVTSLPGDLTVQDEIVTFVFAGDHQLYFPEETSLISHQERSYKKPRISELKAGQFSSLPALAVVPGGPKVAVTEADLLDYPGMDLTAAGAPHALKGLFPAYPLKTEMSSDRTENVTERAPYIAKTSGTRAFPWRVIVVAERDEVLLDTDMVYRLASDTTMTDTGWIQPGKVAWDWWNFNNIYGVPFRAGVNTETYKHYIDFAAENGLEYVILDEGWYTLGDLLAVVPAIDMDALAVHAKQRNVGLIMWVVWKTFDQQMDAALDQFEKWGVKGIKVDFMQREDQWMVNYYERVAKAAGARKMLVDFHGAYKPTGLHRTYPHVVTSEGVLGLEQSKWGEEASPTNAVTFPFLRMMAGPVDYTPGAMMNAAKADFKPIFNRPMSQGTRCHQLAMYVVYESPLQMLADTPSNYRNEPESLALLAKVPVVWDETRILSAALGEHILTARRSGADWWVGGLTNWDARDVEIDLSFLGAGSFQAEIHRDGPNADRVGVDYVREVKPVGAGDSLQIHLAPGGGLAIRITRLP
jgi:alpha-glucosidase